MWDKVRTDRGRKKEGEESQRREKKKKLLARSADRAGEGARAPAAVANHARWNAITALIGLPLVYYIILSVRHQNSYCCGKSLAIVALLHSCSCRLAFRRHIDQLMQRYQEVPGGKCAALMSVRLEIGNRRASGTKIDG